MPELSCFLQKFLSKKCLKNLTNKFYEVFTMVTMILNKKNKIQNNKFIQKITFFKK